MFSERQKVNLLSLGATLLVLLLAIEISSGNFATRINKISENLDKALSDVLNDEKVNFTELPDNVTYVSDASFNPKGMAGLYNFTNSYMDVVLSKNLYPRGFIKIRNNELEFGDFNDEWKTLVQQYGGVLAMVIILAIIFILMPVCGLCFCCCRCCGKCGARSQPFDKKHDLCKKIVLATLLILCGTALLFGVVCVFVSNQQIQEGIDGLTDSARKGVKDVDTYLGNTKEQIEVLLKTNYAEFDTDLLTTIDNSREIVYDQLSEFSKAIAMTEVTNLVNDLPNITMDLQTLKYSTNSLRVYASQLSDAVRKVKKDMWSILNNSICTEITECKAIQTNISNLNTNIHFNNLPDVTTQIDQLDRIIKQKNLSETVQKGTDNLNGIKDEIGRSVNTTLITAKQKIQEAGASITSKTQDVTKIVVDLKERLNRGSKPFLSDADYYIKEYGPYRYYGALVISCLLLLITIFIALGLICGICGKRPEGYGDDCCNKGAGSCFLICGVNCMFLTGFLIAFIVLISFLVGIAIQRTACDSLRNPNDSQVFELVDQLNLSDFHINVNLSHALKNCYNNMSIYEVFNLESTFNLTDIRTYLEKYNISGALANLNMDELDSLRDFKILDESDMQVLEDFAQSQFADINFDEFKDLLETNFLTLNLTDLSAELGSLIFKIREKNTSAAHILAHDLEVQKSNIEMYQARIVEPMIYNATNVIYLAGHLEDSLYKNFTNFHERMNFLIDEIHNASTKISGEGFGFLNKTIYAFTDGIKSRVSLYIDRVVNKTQTEMGQCGPLSLVIKATLTATCDRILQPWNGYWFGLFWSLLLFIPTIIIAVKLSVLYQKHSAYSRELVEAEYLYDAYLDRDNIPLNSRNHKSKKKNKKHKRHEDRPVTSSTGGDMVAREFAGGSNHSDARYADMAPKQWEDFPAGGPPQYQRAPTEYERPPPYYYPGSGESNH